MLRSALGKVLNGGPLSPKHAAALTRASSTQAPKKPEQIEVFIDDIPVKVDPGTTVLQVSYDKEIKVLFNMCLVYELNFSINS